MDNRDNRPLSEQFAVAAAQWVDAEAAASLLEDTKSAVMAHMITKQGDIAVNRAETNAKASEEWREHVTKIVEARKEANHWKVQMEYFRMRYGEWNNEQANARTEARL